LFAPGTETGIARGHQLAAASLATARAQNLRGNVDTRLRKLDEGKHDAIVLASAGLRRLGWEARIAEFLPPEIMCPAAGQGALAIQTRDDGGDAFCLMTKLDDGAARAAVEAERALLTALGGGCQVPIGAHASVHHDVIRLIAMVASPDGSRLIRADAAGMEPAQVGAELGATLLAKGARAILAA
jgi:hydroxymethylbilane synthase